MSAPKLTLVAAVAKNGVIGHEGGLPWRMSTDLRRFKADTMGKPVLMGRKTWDDLRLRPLPGRPNLVLSRDLSFRAEGGFTYSKLDALVAAGRSMAQNAGVEEFCVIGGSLLFAETLPLADRLRLSEIDLEPEGDAHFPSFNIDEWIEISREDVARGEKDDAAFVARVLERKK
jgi:dihydrofolate reductase